MCASVSLTPDGRHHSSQSQYLTIATINLSFVIKNPGSLTIPSPHHSSFETFLQNYPHIPFVNWQSEKINFSGLQLDPHKTQHISLVILYYYTFCTQSAIISLIFHWSLASFRLSQHLWTVSPQSFSIYSEINLLLTIFRGYF